MKTQNIILLLIFLIGIGLIYIGINENNQNNVNIESIHTETIKINAITEIKSEYPESVELHGKEIMFNRSIKNETN